MERRRDRQELVRAGKVAPELPAASRRNRGGIAAGAELRRSRLLNAEALKAALREKARAEGFDAFGVTKPAAIGKAGGHFEGWIARGSHGDMNWLARTRECRADPNVLWPQAKSVIALGLNYGPDENPLALLSRRAHGAISVYARGADYHELIKGKLKHIGQWLVQESGGEIKVFVDTAPVMEKPLAAA